MALEHGRHLHLAVRPDAARRVLLFGHMDTVYGADHPFQTLSTRADGALVGPGVTDMKGGLAVMLAALKAVESRWIAEGFPDAARGDQIADEVAAASIASAASASSGRE